MYFHFKPTASTCALLCAPTHSLSLCFRQLSKHQFICHRHLLFRCLFVTFLLTRLFSRISIRCVFLCIKFCHFSNFSLGFEFVRVFFSLSYTCSDFYEFFNKLNTFLRLAAIFFCCLLFNLIKKYRAVAVFCHPLPGMTFEPRS